MRNHKDKKKELEKMKEMLNIDAESLKKFEYKYSIAYIGLTSPGNRTRTCISGKCSSFSRRGKRKTRK